AFDASETGRSLGRYRSRSRRLRCRSRAWLVDYRDVLAGACSPLRVHVRSTANARRDGGGQGVPMDESACVDSDLRGRRERLPSRMEHRGRRPKLARAEWLAPDDVQARGRSADSIQPDAGWIGGWAFRWSE